MVQENNIIIIIPEAASLPSSSEIIHSCSKNYHLFPFTVKQVLSTMKAYVQTACLLGFAALSIVSGLGLTDLPDCAVSRINSHCRLLEILGTNLKMKKPCAENLPAQCSKVDFKCICGSTDWISGISCCVLKSCSAADQQSQCTRRIRTSF